MRNKTENLNSLCITILISCLKHYDRLLVYSLNSIDMSHWIMLFLYPSIHPSFLYLLHPSLHLLHSLSLLIPSILCLPSSILQYLPSYHHSPFKQVHMKKSRQYKGQQSTAWGPHQSHEIRKVGNHLDNHSCQQNTQASHNILGKRRRIRWRVLVI